MSNHPEQPESSHNPWHLVARALVVCALAVWGPFADAQTSLDEILERGTVRIAVPLDFPPFGSMGADGKPVGYDIDIAKLIAGDLGVALELVPVTSANRIPYLLSRKADIVVSSLGASPKRAKVIAFSTPYAPFFSGVYGPNAVRVDSLAELSGKSIGVTRGTLEDLEITRTAPAGTRIVRFEDNAVTISALLAGQVDVIATGNVVAAAVAKKHPERISRKFMIKNSPCHIGIRRSEQDLLNWVNVFIYHKKLGGELDRLSKRWFGESLPTFPQF